MTMSEVKKGWRFRPAEGVMHARILGAPDLIVFKSDVSEETGRLIASAPDLLAFAQALDASWSETFPLGPDVDDPDRFIKMADEHRQLWRHCRAAISRATGATDE
jgi:hypothetical protein